MPKKLKQVEQPVEDNFEVKVYATQEFAEQVVAAHNAEQAELAKKKGLVAYAAFDCNSEHYEPGDEFTPPAGWTRDANYDEFRGIQIKNSLGKDIGRAFNTPSGLQIVPVKEA